VDLTAWYWIEPAFVPWMTAQNSFPSKTTAFNDPMKLDGFLRVM
jgi:hypothetical protein